MPLLDIIIMAIVQGITEFLPISSDGHLVITNAILEACGRPKTADLMEVELMLHLGTLAAVLMFYRREIIDVLTTQRRAIVPIVLGTIPAVLIGLPIEKGLPDEWHDWLLGSPLLAGLGFLITAAFLWWGTRHMNGTQQYQDIRPRQALLIGLMQAFAILPGVSRSGLTISTGLATGLERANAATYSFLLAIPVIGGAGLLKIVSMMKAGHTGTPVPTLAIGFVVSMIVGLGALAVLLRWLRHGRLMGFVYYLFPLGIAVTAWQLLR